MGYQGPCAAGLQVSLTRTSYFDDCAPMLVSHLAPYKGCRQACKRKLKNHKWAQMKRTRHIANRLRSLRHPCSVFFSMQTIHVMVQERFGCIWRNSGQVDQAAFHFPHPAIVAAPPSDTDRSLEWHDIPHSRNIRVQDIAR